MWLLISFFCDLLDAMRFSAAAKCVNITKFTTSEKTSLLRKIGFSRELFDSSAWHSTNIGKQYVSETNGSALYLTALRFDLRNDVTAKQFRFQRAMLMKPRGESVILDVNFCLLDKEETILISTQQKMQSFFSNAVHDLSLIRLRDSFLSFIEVFRALENRGGTIVNPWAEFILLEQNELRLKFTELASLYAARESCNSMLYALPPSEITPALRQASFPNPEGELFCVTKARHSLHRLSLLKTMTEHTQRRMMILRINQDDLRIKAFAQRLERVTETIISKQRRALTWKELVLLLRS